MRTAHTLVAHTCVRTRSQPTRTATGRRWLKLQELPPHPQEEQEVGCRAELQLEAPLGSKGPLSPEPPEPAGLRGLGQGLRTC